MTDPLSQLPVPILCGVFGLFVGSFLNVVVYRYPIADQTVSRPRRSRCPKCAHELSWYENVPVLSWLVQLGRCRSCRWRIPLRYPLVELLTAALWAHAGWWTPEGEYGLLGIRLLVVSALVVATFVDLDTFEIPDSVSIGGMVAAPILSLLVPELHADSDIVRWMSPGAEQVGRIESLSACLAGMLVGGGTLYLVGALGSRAFGREAMGLGDVKLMAAGGGFVGAGGVLAALLIGSLLGAVAGLTNLVRFYLLIRGRDRARGRRRGAGRALATARAVASYIPFGPYLAVGLWIALLHRPWIGIAYLSWSELVRGLFV